MAEAFIQTVIETLASLSKEEVGTVMGVDKEMKKISSIFTTIQAVLEDAQLNHLDTKPVQDWLAKLEDVAYDIEDVMDECATHVAKSKHLPGRYFWQKMLTNRDVARKIREVTERLEEIAAEKEKFHLHETYFVKRRKVVADSEIVRETGSLLNESQYIFGRDDDTRKIVDLLLNQDKPDRRTSVLPIHGVGGLGKTTLAQLVFNDQHMRDYFELKIWVSVNDNFDLKFLLSAMIESGERASPNLQYVDALQRRVHDMLNRKRYLIVLDDVWSYDQEKWFQLRNVLACGAEGSSIVVTTRLRNVAEIVGTLPIYELKGLSNEHCLALFKHRAFRCVEEELMYPELDSIGKQIVTKCAGVPLAAKALGGLLRFKRTEKEWIHVKESEIWGLPEEEGNKILPVLKLSYHNLPLELRQCFAYCGTFNKNFGISKEELIYLWMAHGYISSDGRLDVEEVGEQVLYQLITRSLLQIKEYSWSKKEYITIHDLVHDLARSLINRVLGLRLGNLPTSVSNGKIRQVNSPVHYVDMSSNIKNYDCLRVADTKYDFQNGCPKINVLPSTLGSLKHLRLLNLSGFPIETLPESICNIWNLKVLILNRCFKLVIFPEKMRNLKNLRHFLLEDCESLRETPFAIRELTCLRSLSKFIVGKDKGRQLDELECLNLGGKIEILNLELAENPSGARKAKLVEKQNLRELCLTWKIVSSEDNLRESNDKEIFEALQLPPNIQDLKIKGFGGRHFPSCMNELSLKKLSDIRINDCMNLHDCSHLGELPVLKVLHMVNCASIEYLVRSGNGAGTSFPSLEKLWLYNLRNLKGFSDDEDMCPMLPMLQKLEVSECSPSLILPPLDKLEELICSKLNTGSLPMLNNLTKLEALIGNDECIPIERFPNLITLKIRGAHDKCLAPGWMNGLNCLRTLKIGLGSMTCLPNRWLSPNSSLQELRIHCCSELMDIPEEIKHLRSLRSLTLCGLPKMVLVPNAIKHLSGLEQLHLWQLHQLTSLPDWLGDLTSLTTLDILGCKNLASVPDSIKGIVKHKDADTRNFPSQ